MVLQQLSQPPKPIILDLDLDFFISELSYIDFDLAQQKILDLAKQASLITIATSPISQYIAVNLKPLRDFFLILFFFSVGARFDLA